MNRGSGVVAFQGNFVDVSGAFGVNSDEPTVCQELLGLIKENMGSVAYKEAAAARSESLDRAITDMYRGAGRRTRSKPPANR